MSLCRREDVKGLEDDLVLPKHTLFNDRRTFDLRVGWEA